VTTVARADARRPTYHHGDLSNALLSAATDLARSAGPQAIVLREAARMVGVSGSSAYRHFADHRALVSAVKRRAQEELTATMQAEPVQRTGDPAADALARVRALGRGYVRFARTQPGLFRTAFDADTPRQETSESFALLTAALDTLVSSGAMPSAARAGAETAVWATVHGLAELMLDGGPLSGLTDDDKTAETDRALEFITRALISSR
jgi:AcrR family transcriptional regulator